MIQVLFLAANPAGTTPLALDEEIRAIDAKIRGAEYRDRLELASHWAVRLDDLSGLLMAGGPTSSTSAAMVTLWVRSSCSPPTAPPSPSPPRRWPGCSGCSRTTSEWSSSTPATPSAGEGGREGDRLRRGDEPGDRRRPRDRLRRRVLPALGFGRSVQDAYDLGVTRLMGEGVANAKGLVKLRKRRGINPADLVLVGDKHESNREPEVGAQPGRPAGQEASTPGSAPIKEEVRAVLRPLMPDRDRRQGAAGPAPSPPTPACSTASPTTVRPVSSCPR